jgi:hypothetical protein
MTTITTTMIHQQFFGIQLFENPADLELLIPFFYKDSEDLHSESLSEPVSQPPQNTYKGENIVPSAEPLLPVEPRRVPQNEWFEPHQKDTLFWCVFVGVFGLSEYLLIHNKYANREWEEKQNMISAFTKTSAELRRTNHKITLGNIKEMMSEYMTNQNTISLLGLVGLSVHYKIQIFLIDVKKRVHYVYTPESYTHKCFIYRDGNARYRLFLGDESQVKPTFCLDTFSRPLRAISSYKRQELIDIAAELKITVSDKEKKEDLYRKISEFAAWI